MDFRQPEGFGGVDISEASDHALIHQDFLDRAGRVRRRLKLLEFELGKRIWTDLRDRGMREQIGIARGRDHFAEASRIDIVNPVPIFEREVSVREPWALGSVVAFEFARHPEMDSDPAVIGKPEENPFSAPTDRHYLLALDSADEFRRRKPSPLAFAVGRPNLDDSVSYEPGAEALGLFFDVGKLRHSCN
jgi:hypothetical protein